MAHFDNWKKSPEFWVMRQGKVTASDAMRYYGISQEDAVRMLDNLVRDRRLAKFTEAGMTWWKRP
jgi:hypothetical protein